MFKLFMENKGSALVTDDSQNKGGTNPASTQGDVILKQGSVEDTTHYVSDPHKRDVALDETPKHFDPSTTEVNMEATIDPDDVVRAGGFGARDDISSFLPVASDSTDFEASLLDARDYEEPQGEQRRPGLGWSKD